MNKQTDKTAENATDREVLSSRVFDAAPDRLFKAWSDPKHLSKWWGPKGFTNTFEEFDFKPGGEWRFVMHGPDGKSYENHSRFVEITAAKRIVFDHLSGHTFRATFTFEDVSGKTKLTFRMVFDDAAECAKVRPFVSDANEQNFDRLVAELKNVR